MKKKLTGGEKKYLRGLAHDLKPVIQIGKGGLTDKVVAHFNEIFQDHELIKIKFNEFREEKKIIATEIEERVPCEMAGMIGNVAIFYREHPEKEKRVIMPVPKRKSTSSKKIK